MKKKLLKFWKKNNINKNNPYTFNTSIKQFLKNSTNKKINKNDNLLISSLSIFI